MNEKLFVLFICPEDSFLSKTEAIHIETCKRLCQDFEGEFLRLESSDVVNSIVEVARQKRITQIVLGESRRSRLQLLLRGSIVQRLMKLLPEVDLHIIANH